MSQPTKTEEHDVTLSEGKSKVSVLHVSSKGRELSKVAQVLKPLRIVLAAAVIAGAGFFLWHSLSHVHSRQAFINGMLIQVRSPIEGVVHMSNINPGEEVTSNRPLAWVTNRRSQDLQTSYEQYAARILEDQRELDNVDEAMVQCEDKLVKYREMTSKQSHLDVEYAKNEVLRYQNEWNDSIEAAKYAKEESENIKRLATMGVLPLRFASKAESDYLRAERITEAKLGQVHAAEAQLKAAGAGLAVGNNRELSTPANRIDELERERNQLKLKQIDLRMSLSQDRFALSKAKSELALDSTVTMKAPERGVIWSLLARSGELVTPGTAIANILIPQKRWVEAFVSEKDVHRLHIGGRARVKLLGTGNRFYATIESIRAGVGRVDASQPVAVPPPERARKETELRLAVDWAHVHLTNDYSNSQFYGVGRSVEVDFD